MYVGFGFKVVYLPALKHLFIFYTIMCLCYYGFVKKKKNQKAVIILYQIYEFCLLIYSFIPLLLLSHSFHGLFSVLFPNCVAVSIIFSSSFLFG